MQTNASSIQPSGMGLARTPAMCEKMLFLSTLKQYIRHKKILSAYSGYYKSMAKMDSLAKCIQLARAYCLDMQAISLKEAARMVLIHDKHLRAILPARLNDSYKSSEQNLENLLTAARNICNSQAAAPCL